MVSNRSTNESGMIGAFLMIAIFLFFATTAFATGGPPDCPPGHQNINSCNDDDDDNGGGNGGGDGGGDVTVNNDNRSRSDADATARSHSDSEANSVGTGIAHSEGGDARSSSDSSSRSEGGDASVGDTTATAHGGTGEGGDATATSGDVSGHIESTIHIQDEGVTVEGDDVAVKADELVNQFNAGDYSYSYKYEEAAAGAAILYGQVCQDTTNIQGVKFGVGTQRQSVFCQRMALATGFLSTALMHDCPDAPSVLKGGGKTIATPNPTQCQLDQRRAYMDGIDEMRKARDTLDGQKDGFLKRLLNKVW